MKFLDFSGFLFTITKKKTGKKEKIKQRFVCKTVCKTRPRRGGRAKDIFVPCKSIPAIPHGVNVLHGIAARKTAVKWAPTAPLIFCLSFDFQRFFKSYRVIEPPTCQCWIKGRCFLFSIKKAGHEARPLFSVSSVNLLRAGAFPLPAGRSAPSARPSQRQTHRRKGRPAN